MPLQGNGNVFLHRFMGLSEVDYDQNWIGVVFREQAASPPLVAKSPEEAARFVAAHPEAIAVVTNLPTMNGVRVLGVDGKSPEAADYPLRW